MKNLKQEQEYLERTLKRFEESIEDSELRADAIPRMYSDNPIVLRNLLQQATRRLELLKRMINKPYFARIDFKSDDEGKIEECYIGKVGVFDEDDKIVTVDWRAPIASIYYDSNIGRASYTAPVGKITGDLLVKRQYDIEDKELKSFQDVDTVSNDEILKPYLGVNVDNRLKNIVATIQSEQNEIIRDQIYNNLIVQGVAGSGKTTVALHRVAYLVYNNIKNIKPEQYLVIGPNKFFVNYISGVLPDLDVDNVSQLTYDEIVNELLPHDFKLTSDEPKLKKSISDPNQLFFERLRVSMVYKNAIDKFLYDFQNTIVPKSDFTIRGYKIVSKNLMFDFYNNAEKDGVLNYDILAKKISRVQLFIARYIDTNNETIEDNVIDQFYDKIDTLSNSEIVKEKKALEYVKKEIRNNCTQSLKKYFSLSSPKILNLYMDFLKNINKYINAEEYEVSSSAKKVANNIKGKKVDFEDLAALMYLYYRVYGSKNFDKYKHTIIDEAQDFGEFNFYAIKQLINNSSFSIFGDLAQSIYQYRGIENWDNVVNTTFDGDCNIKHLSKSYRTTTEIMDSANNITSFMGLNTAEPVIRHGTKVQYKQVDNNLIEVMPKIIQNNLEKEYSSIAIICKDEEESKSVNKQLRELGINVDNIVSSDTEYKGGLCTIASYLAKGLEFDSVIISDASENRYSSDKMIDMKLLYVAMTRPLHELNILYSGELVKPLQKELKKTR